MSIRARYIIRKFLQNLDRSSPWPFLYDWMMSSGERRVFDRIIKTANVYLEFGSGGSTLRALQKGRSKVHSVESSADWLGFLRKYYLIRRNEGRRLAFHYVDIGPTKRWGYPVDDSIQNLFPDYSTKVFNSIDPNEVDVIFIDGRFRVACALSTILHIVNSEYRDKIILIHDFWNREYYHEVLNYVEVTDQCDTLGVFKINKNIDHSSLLSAYNKYKYDPR